MTEDPMVMGGRSFLRMRIEINTLMPFHFGFWLPRGNDKQTRIKLKYENLKRYCFRCGRLRHIHQPKQPCSHPISQVAQRVGYTYGTKLFAEAQRAHEALFQFVQVKKKGFLFIGS